MKEKIAEILSKETKIPSEEIITQIEIPPDDSMGDYSFPCFMLARTMKKAPKAIAEELAAKIKTSSEIEKIDSVNGYLNFHINKTWLISNILKEILIKEQKFGVQNIGKNKIVLVEMSAPNIAKAFGIGHLRSTMIGNSIAKIHSALGFSVKKLNYLGDWGTQFGKLIYAYQKYGDEKKLKEHPIQHLQELYVKINASMTEEIEQESRDIFKKLENGDKDLIKIWKQFKELSLVEFDHVYDLLGVTFDDVQAESDFNKKAEEVFSELEKKKLVVESQGAYIVDLEKYNLGVSIVKKMDGTTIYASRDLAAAISRQEKYKFEKLIYEVGAEQELHFKQFFKILELMGYTWSKNLEHASHGLYLGTDGKKLSTRQGKSYKMIDIWDSISEKIEKMVEQSSKLDKKEIDKRTMIITRAAIVYGDLKNYRRRDLIFDSEKIVLMEGETGPYMLYTYARANSILNKIKFKKKEKIVEEEPTKEEVKLVKTLSQYPDVLMKAYKDSDPSQIANYAFAVAKQFNSFYENCTVVGDTKEEYRAQVIYAYKTVLGNALDLLGIQVLDEM